MTTVNAGLKHSLDAIDDTDIKRKRTYLFDGQSAMDYATVRPEFDSLFLQYNCSEFVNRSHDEVPSPTGNQRLLTETIFNSINIHTLS